MFCWKGLNALKSAISTHLFGRNGHFKTTFRQKIVRSAKYLFSKEFELSLTKNIFTFPMERKKLLPVKWTFFASKFSDKKYRMQQILYISARTKKTSFFLFNCKTFLSFLWLIVLLKNWQIRVFYPLMCFARFYLLFSEILRVTYTTCFSENLECVFVQLWFKVDECTVISYLASNTKG